MLITIKYKQLKNKAFRIFGKVCKRLLNRNLSFYIQQLFQELNKYPNDIVIETASVCNLNCTICRSVKADLGRKNRFMPLELFKKIVDDIAPICATVGVSYCGEPLLNKDIFAVIRYASDKGMNVSMLTNGILLGKRLAKIYWIPALILWQFPWTALPNIPTNLFESAVLLIGW